MRSSRMTALLLFISSCASASSRALCRSSRLVPSRSSCSSASVAASRSASWARSACVRASWRAAEWLSSVTVGIRAAGVWTALCSRACIVRLRARFSSNKLASCVASGLIGGCACGAWRCSSSATYQQYFCFQNQAFFRRYYDPEKIFLDNEYEYFSGWSNKCFS